MVYAISVVQKLTLQLRYAQSVKKELQATYLRKKTTRYGEKTITGYSERGTEHESNKRIQV